MNAMPRATDSQAVLVVVTWMNAYQLLPCALTIGCHTAGMTTPNRPQAIRPAGASVSSQPARMSTELHTRLRQVSGSAIREPNRTQKLGIPPSRPAGPAGRGAAAANPHQSAMCHQALASRPRMARRVAAVSGRPTPSGMRATTIRRTVQRTRLASVNPNRTTPRPAATTPRVTQFPVRGRLPDLASIVIVPSITLSFDLERPGGAPVFWCVEGCGGAAGEVPAAVAEQCHG